MFSGYCTTVVTCLPWWLSGYSVVLLSMRVGLPATAATYRQAQNAAMHWVPVKVPEVLKIDLEASLIDCDGWAVQLHESILLPM